MTKGKQKQCCLRSVYACGFMGLFLFLITRSVIVIYIDSITLIIITYILLYIYIMLYELMHCIIQEIYNVFQYLLQHITIINMFLYNYLNSKYSIKHLNTLWVLLTASKGWSRRCNFPPWDKGQCPHGTLLHAVPGYCKCFQQCQIAGSARVGTLGSYLTLLETFATPMGQRGTMLHGDTVPCPKEKSCIVWTDLKNTIFHYNYIKVV